MISVRNHRLLSSGNKILIFIAVGFIFAACSPKVRTTTGQNPKNGTEKPVVKVSAGKKRDTLKTPIISLLLPFGLNHLQPGANYGRVSLKEADIAIDYYRGFKLALDSLTAAGYSFKLQIFDTKDSKAYAKVLTSNSSVKTSDLIVGPVFPDGIKAFTANYFNKNQPIVSPLSASSAANYKAPSLITVTPPLEFHAFAAAKYIAEKIRTKKVFVLRSGPTEENDYITPFNKALDSLSDIKVVETVVSHGQLNALVPALSKTGQNVFVIPATDQHFLNVTLRTLDSLAAYYQVTVIGHPSWMGLSFLKEDLLQRLNTVITRTDEVDYKAENMQTFLKNYLQTYHTDATMYAIKGFDQGMYFGKLMSTGSIKNITSTDFTALDNDFHFEKREGQGWINTHVDVIKYSSSELKKVE
jgi:hypothetical protein